MKMPKHQLSLLRLVQNCAKEEGWAPVSKPIMSLVVNLPADLAEVETHEDGTGRVRLTEEGKAVVKWI